MAIFELVITWASSKARSVIKIDIVKPIPPNIPAPIMFPHFKSLGNAHSPKRIPSKEKSPIPNGLPTISPNKIPNEFEYVNPSCQFESMAIHVLAIANKGRIKNATGLCKKCCKI